MTRVEIAGYVQIVVGLVGIVLTALTAPAALDALGQISSGSGVPAEFAGVGGAIRVFVVLFVLIALLFLVALGFTITLSTLTRALGGANPLHVSGAIVCALLSFATCATLLVFSGMFWLPAFVGGLVLLIMGFVGANDPDGGDFWGVFGLGLIPFIVCGIIALVSLSPAVQNQTEPDPAEAASTS